ncbi:MAG: glutamate-1-semialdehyde 2,1-aminomutase [Candidatus Omnitrophica bacterium]|nr:glutamate-1-semialdehyde 2,1-aminomutase [Candidatus Omnitrophota bacterium]
MKRVRRRSLWQEAQRFLAGGVNSPVRAFQAVGEEPLFVSRARGAYLFDERGRRYIDYIQGWGPAILGHAHPAVMAAIRQQLQQGLAFGLPTAVETALAREIAAALPSIEQLRFTSSGTEACMSAIRLARGVTGRTKIVKFEGGYHGHGDGFLVKAGSGMATFGLASSAGVPKAVADETIVLPYNNVPVVHEALERLGSSVACVIVEPVAANMGVVAPEPGFLSMLRQVTKQQQILLIFDEVITGFRLAYGGAQTVFKVRPDLTILGKIIGGGLPCGAFGGPRALMSRLAPTGDVYQAGTLSGHPLAMAAGLATLRWLKAHPPYALLAARTRRLVDGLRRIAADSKMPVQVQASGSLWTAFFARRPVTGWATARQASTERYAQWFRCLRREGVLLPPSQFEACFVGVAHTDGLVDATMHAARAAFRAMA